MYIQICFPSKVYKFVHLLAIADFELLHGVLSCYIVILQSIFTFAENETNCFSLKYISKIANSKGNFKGAMTRAAHAEAISVKIGPRFNNQRLLLTSPRFREQAKRMRLYVFEKIASEPFLSTRRRPQGAERLETSINIHRHSHYLN